MCHVLCPSRTSFLNGKPAARDYYVQAAERGAELAFYCCSGPVRSLDPYSYHRLQAWTCWQFHAKSSYFWAFGDGGGGSSWNEYEAAGANYVPMFLDALSVIAGKHMEAIREGIEDFEYLLMLEQQLSALETSGVKRPALDHAKAILQDAPCRVCGAPGATQINWSNVKDRSLADRVRTEILQAMNTLR
jgi:hypothetical protein